MENYVSHRSHVSGKRYRLSWQLKNRLDNLREQAKILERELVDNKTTSKKDSNYGL